MVSRNIFHVIKFINTMCTLDRTVWKFTNFCLTVIFSKALNRFRENNVLKALYSKMALGMAQFCMFRANMRKFDPFGLVVEDLDYQNPLKPL